MTFLSSSPFELALQVAIQIQFMGVDIGDTFSSHLLLFINTRAVFMAWVWTQLQFYLTHQRGT